MDAWTAEERGAGVRCEFGVGGMGDRPTTGAGAKVGPGGDAWAIMERCVGLRCEVGGGRAGDGPITGAGARESVGVKAGPGADAGVMDDRVPDLRREVGGGGLGAEPSTEAAATEGIGTKLGPCAGAETGMRDAAGGCWCAETGDRTSPASGPGGGKPERPAGVLSASGADPPEFPRLDPGPAAARASMRGEPAPRAGPKFGSACPPSTAGPLVESRTHPGALFCLSIGKRSPAAAASPGGLPPPDHLRPPTK
ncbi:hypothetical protein BDK51DRAFT_33059 [Blyttiomyces helicus]|uniref:Uncharacterized protein n=1 Tax=Blyttiomyces helicus TaxID=388810 RepID=A0A4V1IR76_9FUNG|nr:hypothetical protein BDK51DRAFT_33059 [Blyttiomyces helicus]|eukprot:RKO89087.1 hypothetical protein BDK51DRAFT_33059 [Blyttiomyces helicus]